MRLPHRALKWLRNGAALLIAMLVAVLALRVYQVESGPPLEPWHTVVPEELSAAELDAADWPAFLAAEGRAFETVRQEVTEDLPPEDRVPFNRYFKQSPVNPASFATDWNRSFVLEPQGAPRGVAVLIHGLTDAPYSLRHIAELYRSKGFVAIAVRMPGHGTVPAGLSVARWEQWLAASRLAVREARRRVPAPAPLHVVGYSNGGALAMLYALRALDGADDLRPERVVLLSPMIGVTSFARFAGLAGLPAILPAFAKAAWLNLTPEFNPFKYNSFPVNAAVQSYQLTEALRQAIEARQADGGLARLPPVLAFQSVLDATVSARAVVSTLFERLPAQGSEITLFDINRATKMDLLFRPSTVSALSTVLRPAPRSYRVRIVGTSSATDMAAVERVTQAGGTEETLRPLGRTYPAGVFSLSHVALPFPPDDALYGSIANPADSFGVRLGADMPRGERGALVVDADTLTRLSSNPFYDVMARHISDAIDADVGPRP